MYSKSLCKTLGIKYGNWLVNPSFLRGRSKQSVNIILDASHRLFCGLVKRTTTQCVSQSLPHPVLKKCDSHQFGKGNLEPSTWKNIRKTIHYSNINAKNVTKNDASESYQHESPELRDILNELYKENDPEISPSDDSRYKGKYAYS